MKIKYGRTNSAEKKRMISIIGEVVSVMPKYLGTPSMAFQIGEYQVDKHGDLIVPDWLDATEVIEALKDFGFEGEVEGEVESAEAEPTVEEAQPEPAAEAEPQAEPTVEEPQMPEPIVEQEQVAEHQSIVAEEQITEPTVEETQPEPMVEPEPQSEPQPQPQEADTEEEPGTESFESIHLDIAFPLAKHTSRSIRNLVTILYSRGELISKAVQGEFSAPKEILDGLGDKDPTTVKEQLERIRQLEAETGVGIKGIEFDEEKLTFTGFPATQNMDLLAAFQHLADKINAHAIKQKHVQVKAIKEENEKYSLRTWLVRIGMGGVEYKKTRNLLMKHLAGHTAFKTPADAERWKARQAEHKAERMAAAMTAVVQSHVN